MFVTGRGFLPEISDSLILDQSTTSKLKETLHMDPSDPHLTDRTLRTREGREWPGHNASPEAAAPALEPGLSSQGSLFTKALRVPAPQQRPGAEGLLCGQQKPLCMKQE